MEVKQWRNNYNPVAQRDLALWEHKLTTALKKLPYLSHIKFTQPEWSVDNHLIVKAQLKDIKSNADSVVKDFMTLLHNYVIGPKQAVSALLNTPEGFTMDIAILDEDQCYFLLKLQTAYS